MCKNILSLNLRCVHEKQGKACACKGQPERLQIRLILTAGHRLHTAGETTLERGGGWVRGDRRKVEGGRQGKAEVTTEYAGSLLGGGAW